MDKDTNQGENHLGIPVYLIYEVFFFKELISLGFRELELKENYNTENINVPFFALSNGIERLLKVCLILNEYKETKEFPIEKRLWDKGPNGHNLKVLLKNVLELNSIEECAKSRNMEDDIEFLKSDEILTEFIEILTCYAKNDRYWNLDYLLNNQKGSTDPIKKWKKFIEKISQNNEKPYKKINDTIERFLKIFLSMLNRGFFGITGKNISMPLISWIMVT